MNAVRVSTEIRLEEELTALGFTKTPMSTETGTYWLCNSNKRHLQVPFCIDGFCPDWMWAEVMEKAELVRRLPRRPSL